MVLNSCFFFGGRGGSIESLLLAELLFFFNDSISINFDGTLNKSINYDVTNRPAPETVPSDHSIRF